ncbi:hypothetical protein STEG23_027577 [Scotinomys teguina]
MEINNCRTQNHEDELGEIIKDDVCSGLLVPDIDDQGGGINDGDDDDDDDDDDDSNDDDEKEGGEGLENTGEEGDKERPCEVPPPPLSAPPLLTACDGTTAVLPQVCGTSESPSEDLAQLRPGERQDPHSEDGKRRGPSTPAPTSLSSPVGFIPRYFRPMGTGSTTIKIILKEKHKKACTHNGKTYSHGEVWHPTVLSFGPMPCILCTCVDGYQDCHRVTCPTQYPCSQPKKVSGKCCKICPEDEADADHSEVIAKCPKVPGQVSVYTLVSPSSDDLHRFVLEHEASDQVEIYNWRLVKGIFHLVQIKRVRKQDFQKEAQNFRLLTGTHEGYWTIFLAQTPELKVTASPDKVTKTL